MTIPEIITTSTGLKRNTKPTTITAMPISGQRDIASCIITSCSVVSIVSVVNYLI
ncbi:hypothetical protein UUU_11300 [Klebsiella pneumoniae subsp. pneumoniae DSM 30104 = JCM 1662 = NBRC 14940]|nr:hypothetical protein UUU_11300 [Klebsiella pneumoniae subsp. pneumoniae DSM 30104 = JCM 1662 = NBRC 14940]